MITFIFQLIQLFGWTNAAANTIFAHMVNHPDAVRWALEKGANAIEMDLRFDGSKPNEFRHGGACDCSCLCPIGSTCSDNSVCNKLWKITGSHCNAKSTADEMTKALGSPDLHDKLAVIYIDSKIDDNTPLRESGENIVKLLNENVFEKGYKGQVIISGSEVKYFDYLKGALSVAKASKFVDQYFYTYDAEGRQYERVFSALKQLDTKNIAYSTGISACAPGTYEDAIKGSISKNAYAGIGIWTIDKESSMKDYVNYGVTSIMTNRIDNALAVVKAENLAKPGSALKVPGGPSKDPQELCDCDYSKNGGCVLKATPPKGKACKCEYKGAWTCGGKVTDCNNPENPKCKEPDNSLQSCLLGGGDCGGYKESCDCNYKKGGCTISKLPPDGSACKCKYKGAWTCGGEVTACNDPKSPLCVKPDSSKDACKLGGGDCDGYK